MNEVLTLTGDKILVRPKQSGKTDSGLILTGDAKNVNQQYVIGLVGPDVTDERTTPGQVVVLTNATIATAQSIEDIVNTGEDAQDYKLVTESAIVGYMK